MKVMEYVVLGAWIVQALVGVWLLWSGARGPHKYSRAIAAHVALSAVMVALWVLFLLSGHVAYAWASWATLAVAIPFGETMMVSRSRRRRGVTHESARDYGGAVVDVFRGRMPGRVIFHALFAGVVFFSALGVSIGATIARA